MKGTIVSTWLNSLRDIFDDNIVDTALKSVDWNKDRVISPLEDIDDDEIFKIFNQVSRLTNIPTNEIWRKVGRQNIYSFQKWFPSYIVTKPMDVLNHEIFKLKEYDFSSKAILKTRDHIETIVEQLNEAKEVLKKY